MSLHLDQVQANPQTFYSPQNSQPALLLSANIPTGATNTTNPAGLVPGLYAIMVQTNNINGYSINSLIYWNGTNWSAGGLAQNSTSPITFSIYSADPNTVITLNNTSGAAIACAVYLVPLTQGRIPGLP
jgi:hypothetical protein